MKEREDTAGRMAASLQKLIKSFGRNQPPHHSGPPNSADAFTEICFLTLIYFCLLSLLLKCLRTMMLLSSYYSMRLVWVSVSAEPAHFLPHSYTGTDATTQMGSHHNSIKKKTFHIAGVKIILFHSFSQDSSIACSSD